ncbi:MAG: hypothetical protein IH885_07850 [Myxococcales bacterium]|nr:hypothetical protein [Myxococcales bacterium]
MSAEPREAALGLESLVVGVTLLPRFARRLRILAIQEGRTPEAVAARLLAHALVTDRLERRRMVRADLRDAGVER